MISIDCLVLTKNNIDELYETLTSIPSSNSSLTINAIILDGSSSKLDSSFFQSIFQNHSIAWKYFWIPEVNGIYPSMNFALEQVSSDWFIFLNSGDCFHTTLDISLYCDLFESDFLIVFGQAEILSESHQVKWLFPDSKVKSISKWLTFFEPNHQAMFVRGILSKSYLFDTKSPIGADATWKRQLLNRYEYIFLKAPVVTFRLGGISSSYNWRVILIKLKEPSRNFFQKLLEILKFILFKLGVFSPALQKLKSSIIGFFF